MLPVLLLADSFSSDSAANYPVQFQAQAKTTRTLACRETIAVMEKAEVVAVHHMRFGQGHLVSEVANRGEY